MKSTEKYDYDAIIIGAGISGLVCGCYLAKAGLRTLIIEKNAAPGGYCVSFKRKGYQFDACVHFLSTFRKGSKFYKILNNIGLFDKVKIIRHNPSDIIVASGCKVKIYNKPNDTISEFKKCFPGERNQIEKFFKFIISTPTISLSALRNKTLKELLDIYFTDEFLKTLLSVMILGFAGSPPYQISATVACLIYREFVLFDAGYYPVGGMQAFSDGLSEVFTQFGGKILFSNSAKEIKVERNKVKGVVLGNGEYISGKYIVSACDARQTFFKLIGKNNLNDNFVKSIKELVPSYSSFLVYLGMDDNFNCPEELKTNMWVINSREIKEICTKLLKFENIHLAITSPSMKDIFASKNNKKAICLTTTVPFISAEYWKDERTRKDLENRLIKLASQAIPELEKNINLKFNATPLTLYKWTYNYNGASYGWEGRPGQFGNPDISEKTMIDNLYLTGHWNNMGSGVTSVANSGYDTAKMILLKERITNKIVR